MGAKIELNHTFPYCLFMTLTREMTPGDSEKLHLTITFGEQEIPTAFGSVWFGISRGVLSLTLIDGCIPYSMNCLTAALAATIELESTVNVKSAEKIISDDKATASFAGPPKVGLESKVSTEKGEELSVGTKHVSARAQIRAQGPETSPEFVFKVQEPEKRILEGTLKNQELGTIEWNGTQRIIRSKFSISGGDITLTREDMNLLGKLTPMKRKIILARIKAPLRTADKKLCLSHGVSKHA